MTSMSIRTRLTLTIVALTAAISALGVSFGIRGLEGQVRESAIDERIEVFEETREFFLTEAVVVDEFGQVGDAGLRESIALFGADFLSLLPNIDTAIEEIGTSDGELLVLVEAADLVAVTSDSARYVALEETDPNEPQLPLSDLFELDRSIGEFSFEFDLAPPTDEPLELEFDVVDIDGQRYGFVAEVTDELAALEAIRRTLQIVVLALTVLAGLGTWLIAGRALRPVGEMTAEVDEITSGSLSRRVAEPSTGDEIGVLARTMNSMLGRLETSDLRRRQFVSDASHELRTPVAVLRSEAEVAKRAPSSTTIEQLATVVLGESKRLEGLVEDLLSLARGDEDRMVRAVEAIDIDEIVLAEARRTRRVAVGMRGVSAGRIVGHENDVQRSIKHLLDNAARHANESVEVGVQTNDDVVTMWVEDDGPGVPEDDRQRVFERFIRLDDARSRDAGGSGLGLAVVKETVEKMDGTIAISDSELGGARVTMEFPAG